MAVLPFGERIDLAHVVRDADGRPAVHLAESLSVPGGLAAALPGLRPSHRLSAHACTTLLQPGQYQILQLDAPDVPPEERAEALRWQLKDMVDFPVDNASIGVVDIPAEGGANRKASVFAAAAGAGAVWPLMQPFDEARVPLRAIDIPEFAQRNMAALFEEENRGLAFLHFDARGGLLTITYRGELYALRRIEITGRQMAEADEERQAQLLERVMLELQRTLDNFDRQYSFISVSGLVVACAPEVPALQPYLAENLYVPVRGMDLAGVCDLSRVPELADAGRQAEFLPAIGAALRTPGVT